MLPRPSIGAKYRSILTGKYARVKNVVRDRVQVNIDGNTGHIHIRDFLAEYRFVKAPIRR